MSHITHLYHLSALDFINTTSFPGMAPWLPSYTKADMLDGSTGLGKTLVLHYVNALTMRRKLHTAGALFSGRQPIQNALVPGGVTTLLSSTYPHNPVATDYDQYGPYNVSATKSKFKVLLNTVRDFIDNSYVPDVVTVATAAPYTAYWTIGAGCQNLLAYGDYPLNGSGTLAIKRGWTTGLTYHSFDQANIVEQVAHSYYDYPVLDALQYPNGRHPFDGVTVPDMGTANGYTWAKAPRYLSSTTAMVLEVGPLARMAVTHLCGGSVAATSKNAVTIGAATIGAGATYNVSTLVGAAIAVASGYGGSLFSPLGRHAARAVEAKYIADLMADWIEQVDDSQAYTYKRIPKQISTGYGLVEAPRGALGHWIKIESKKVAKYQCVVPTTWNVSPQDNNGTHGPIEQSVIGPGNYIGTTATDQIVNILRLIHPFDICIACTVHVVNPEGKETLKFAIDPDGRPKDIVKA
jgi:hydrogenase large subunit